MKPVALGVIGCGVIGGSHLRTATQSALMEVVAVADLLEEARQAAAERFHVATAYPDGNALLDDPRVEAVVLALPTCGRTPLALRAFERGKHVLTEKPVAMNSGEVEKMIAARGELIAGCCSPRFRFAESAKVATEFIASGALGDLRVLRVLAIGGARERPKTPRPPWRVSKALNGGGILVNWGCYDLDFMLGITGWSLKPELVLAQTWPVAPHLEVHVAPGSDAETHFAALVRFEGGAVMTFERGESVSARTEEAWQITGSKGSLHLRLHANGREQILYDSTSTEHGVTSEVLWQSEAGRPASRNDPLQDFALAIREGRQPRTTLEQSLVVQRITDAIYASAERRVAVGIN